MTGVAEGRIASALFEGLTRLDPLTIEVLPGVATRWEVSENEREWTFRLRGDALWSDGEAVRAEDFRYAWLRVLAPETASSYAGLLFDVEGARDFQAGEASSEAVGIRAPDGRTLVVRLVRPVPYFPSLAAFFTLLPVPRRAIEEHGCRWTRAGNIVTNGPFLLERWAFYREILLARSPLYRGGNPAGTGRIRLIPVVDPNTQFNLFETGAVDVAFSVPSPILHRLADRADFVNGPRLATAFLRLNVTRPPFCDRRVRQAFGHAVDRETLVTRITRGGEKAAGALVPPVLPGYRPPRGLPFSPEQARELLGPGGGEALPVMTLLYPAHPRWASVATVLQHQLSLILGVDVRLDPREWKVYLSAMKALDYDLALGQWIGDYPDPTTFLHCFRTGDGNNRTGWGSSRYDTLLQAAEETRSGETPEEHAARRHRQFAEAERLLVEEEAPIIPLYNPTVRYMVSPRVRGFLPNVLGLVNFADLTLADEEGR